MLSLLCGCSVTQRLHLFGLVALALVWLSEGLIRPDEFPQERQ